MTKTLNLFFFACVLIFSSAFSVSDARKKDQNKHRLYVTAVEPTVHGFALSNNMIFYTIKAMWSFEKLPEVGAEIYLSPIIKFSHSLDSKVMQGDFFAIYSKDGVKEILVVWMLPESEQHCLSYIGAKSVRSQLWFYSAADENFIELSDGSKWISKTVPDFNPGDHVIVTPCFNSDEWKIINLSQPLLFKDVRRLTETYKTAEVKP